MKINQVKNYWQILFSSTLFVVIIGTQTGYGQKIPEVLQTDSVVFNDGTKIVI